MTALEGSDGKLYGFVQLDEEDLKNIYRLML